jgi:hypothetical protein
MSLASCLECYSRPHSLCVRHILLPLGHTGCDTERWSASSACWGAWVVGDRQQMPPRLTVGSKFTSAPWLCLRCSNTVRRLYRELHERLLVSFHERASTGMQTRVQTIKYTHTRMCTHKGTRTHTCTRRHTRAHAGTHTHTHTCTYKHTSTHARAHTHTHTLLQ